MSAPRSMMACLWAACAGFMVLAPLGGACAQPASPDLAFAVFGDSRPGQARYSPVLRKLAADIAGQRPAFVIGTGDYIEGATDQTSLRAQFQAFFFAIQPMQAFEKVSVALAPGNHDILGSTRNQQVFIEYFKALHFSFNRAGCHFVILDSEQPGLAGRIAGAQLAWLKGDLAQSREAALTFVALHRPLFPVDGHIGSSLDVNTQERDALHALFIQEGVDCVFAGHEHLFHRQQRDGVDYVITGGAGAPLYAPPEKGGFHHYILAKVRAGAYTLQVRKLM